MICDVVSTYQFCPKKSVHSPRNSAFIIVDKYCPLLVAYPETLPAQKTCLQYHSIGRVGFSGLRHARSGGGRVTVTLGSTSTSGSTRILPAATTATSVHTCTHSTFLFSPKSRSPERIYCLRHHLWKPFFFFFLFFFLTQSKVSARISDLLCHICMAWKASARSGVQFPATLLLVLVVRDTHEHIGAGGR